MNDNEKTIEAEAEAAADRLQKGLRAAKSILRDYRAKLCNKASPAARAAEARAFRFDR